MEEQIALLDHRNEIGMILENHFTISQDLITMLAEITTQYYTLSEEQNNITEEMKKAHYASI